MLERFVTQVFFGTSSESSVRRILLELSVGKMLFGMPSESRVPRRVTTQGLFSSGFPKLFLKGSFRHPGGFPGSTVNLGAGWQMLHSLSPLSLEQTTSEGDQQNGRFFSAGSCSRGHPIRTTGRFTEEYILDDFSEAVWKLWNWTTPVFSGYIFRYSSTSRFFQMHGFSRLSRWKNCTVRRTVCLGFAGQSMHWRR